MEKEKTEKSTTKGHYQISDMEYVPGGQGKYETAFRR
jgi:hypothetical protein